MALYAFDGTGNEDHADDAEDSNVRKFFDAYDAAYPGRGRNYYGSGVGTRHSVIGMVFGSVFGMGGHERIDEALCALDANFGRGDRHIDVVGFSRGAALALEFVNEVHDSTVRGRVKPKVRFLGLWDTVASFGIPGNNVNLGYTLTLPPNVDNCFHAMSLDERRFTFPLTRVVQDRFSARPPRNLQEVWFRGYHSDVGGGNENEKLSSIALHWMLRRGVDAGLTLAEADVAAHAAKADPAGKCKAPGMDRRANKKRTILESDLVHESVTRRRKADRFAANNPPKGLRIARDNGQIRGRFEQE